MPCHRIAAPLLAALLVAALSSCRHAAETPVQACAQTTGCVREFQRSGYGPIHSQAAAPNTPGAAFPQ